MTQIAYRQLDYIEEKINTQSDLITILQGTIEQLAEKNKELEKLLAARNSQIGELRAQLQQEKERITAYSTKMLSEKSRYNVDSTGWYIACAAADVLLTLCVVGIFWALIKNETLMSSLSHAVGEKNLWKVKAAHGTKPSAMALPASLVNLRERMLKEASLPLAKAPMISLIALLKKSCS